MKNVFLPTAQYVILHVMSSRFKSRPFAAGDIIV